MISTQRQYHRQIDEPKSHRSILYPKKDDSSSQYFSCSSDCPTIIKSLISKCPKKIKIIKKNFYSDSLIKTKEKNIIQQSKSQESNNLTIAPKRLFLFDEENEDIMNHHAKQQQQQEYLEISTSSSNNSFKWLNKNDKDVEILEPVDFYQITQQQKLKKSILIHHKPIAVPQTIFHERLFLIGSSEAIQNTSFEFNCFRDSDLKVPKEHMNKFQELAVDDDVMTDEETLDNFVKICYRDILSGIKYQVTQKKNNRADMKDPLWRYFKPRLFAHKKPKLINK